ncbi:unnamed protein product [Mytilus coruscus]|uniref:Uncharacterized protein n=1 Tax=Mytilus coruscus TaxID=42192 RepID=A0A6J8BCL1_MYTCO|nr:unnamed protein product [Mytilus coruscus]
MNMSSKILNAHSSIKNFETLLSMNLQGLRNDIVQDVIKLFNKVETSPKSIETLKQVHARELKMLREKMQESDIDKKKIIENIEIERCQLMSKAKELERNSYQTKEVFQAAEEKLQNKIIVLTEKQTELEILLHEKHAKLQEKDTTIEKLDDRLLSVKEDILGGQWSAVRGEQQKNESCSKTSGFQHQSNVYHNTKSSASKDTVIQEKEVSFAQYHTFKQNPVNKRVIFHHSSIPKYIDVKRLTSYFQLEGLAKRTATLADLEEYIQQYEDLTDSIVICHVGTNDLRQSPDVVYSAVDKYVEIIENIERLGARIIISSLLPCRTTRLARNICQFNETLYSKIRDNKNVTWCDNSNFFLDSTSYNVKLNLYDKDGLHININEGTRVLAGNLKKRP